MRRSVTMTMLLGMLLLCAGARAQTPAGKRTEERRAQPADAPPLNIPVRGESAAAAIKPPPASHLLDEAALFNPEFREEIAKALTEAGTVANAGLYGVTCTYVDGKCDEYTSRMAEAWSRPDRPAVVVLYEQGSLRIEFAAHGVKNAKWGKLTNEIFRYADACQKAVPSGNRVERVATAFKSLATALTAAAQDGKVPEVPPRADPPPPERDPPPLPERPEGFLLDGSELFTGEDAAELRKALENFSVTQRADVYVAALNWAPLTSTIDENGQEERSAVQATAQKLAESWLGNRYGAVIVHEKSSGKLAIAASTDQHWISAPALDGAMKRAYRAFNDSAESGGQTVGVTSCVYELIASFTAEAPSRSEAARERARSPSRQILLWVMVALCGVAAVIYLFQWIQSRRSRSLRPRYFPDVTVDCRLGAPMGGGVVVQYSREASAEGARKANS